MVPVSGLVNIAAEITIFAQRVYDEMSPHPENACSIYVNLAGGAATTCATTAVGSLGNALTNNTAHVQVKLSISASFLDTSRAFTSVVS